MPRQLSSLFHSYTAPVRIFLCLQLSAGIGCLLGALFLFRELPAQEENPFLAETYLDFADYWRFDFAGAGVETCVLAGVSALAGLLCLFTAGTLIRRSPKAFAWCKALCLCLFAGGILFLLLGPYYFTAGDSPPQDIAGSASLASLLALCIVYYRYFELKTDPGIAKESLPPLGIGLLISLCAMLLAYHAYAILRSLKLLMTADTYIWGLEGLKAAAPWVGNPVFLLVWGFHCILPLWILLCIRSRNAGGRPLFFALGVWLLIEALVLPFSAFYRSDLARYYYGWILGREMLCLYLAALWWHIGSDAACGAWLAAKRGRDGTRGSFPGALTVRRIAIAASAGRPPALVYVFLIFAGYFAVENMFQLAILFDVLTNFTLPGPQGIGILLSPAFGLCAVYVVFWLVCLAACLKRKPFAPRLCQALIALIVCMPVALLVAVGGNEQSIASIFGLAVVSLLMQSNGCLVFFIAWWLYFSRSREVVLAFRTGRSPQAGSFSSWPLPLIVFTLFCLSQLLYSGFGGLFQAGALAMQMDSLPRVGISIFGQLVSALCWLVCPLYFLNVLRMNGKSVETFSRCLIFFAICLVCAALLRGGYSLTYNGVDSFFQWLWLNLQIPLAFVLAGLWYLRDSVEFRDWLAASRER